MKNIIYLILILVPAAVFGQTDSMATDSLPSLEDLLNTRVSTEDELQHSSVSIAGQKDQVLQEAPSIISVITKEDIAHYGARDISEILRMVPGYSFGLDVQSISGLGFRGIWAHEGKALIMINGSSVNDYGYGNTNLIGTIPSAMIERIEIIRGPGSVLYGGFAGVTVINIVTNNPQESTSGHADLTGGFYGNSSFTRALNVSYDMHGKNAEVSAAFGHTIAPLSTRLYEDFFGNRLQLDEKTAYREYYYAIATARLKNFSFHYNRTSQNYPGQDGYTEIIPLANGKTTEDFNNYMESYSAKEDIHISPVFTLIPSAEFQRGNGITSALLPNSVTMAPYGLDGGTRMFRVNGRVLSYLDLKKNGQLMLGVDAARDELSMTAANGSPALQTGPDSSDTAYTAYTYQRSALVEYNNEFNNLGITIGSRYQRTSFGDAFAPRLGITYVYNKLNAKLLYGRAFRIPLPFQAYSRSLGYAGYLKPETSNTLELELGYKISSKLSGRLNTFFIDILKPIKYDGDLNTYFNTGHIQSEGMEAELVARFSGWGGFLNGSVALPGKNSSPDVLTSDKKYFLGLPVFKVDAGVYKQLKSWEFSPSFTFLGPKYGQSPLAAHDSSMLDANKKYPSTFLLNFSISYKNLLKNVDLQLTGSNLLDEKYLLVQPYYGLHAPMPAFDRHITLKTTIRF